MLFYKVFFSISQKLQITFHLQQTFQKVFHLVTLKIITRFACKIPTNSDDDVSRKIFRAKIDAFFRMKFLSFAHFKVYSAVAPNFRSCVFLVSVSIILQIQFRLRVGVCVCVCFLLELRLWLQYKNTSKVFIIFICLFVVVFFTSVCVFF